MFNFEERGKPEKNLSEQSKEPTTNLTHSWPEPGPRSWEASAINLYEKRQGCCIYFFVSKLTRYPIKINIKELTVISANAMGNSPIWSHDILT